MSTVNPFQTALGGNLNAASKEAKDGAGQNAGNLEVPGHFIMKVKVVKNKQGEQISPVLKTMDSGAMMLSLLLTVDDETTEHNGKGLFASVWLMPKLIKVLPTDSPQVAQEKKNEYQKKIVNTLKMNLPSIWALTGDNTLNVDDWERFRLAIGDVNPAKHSMIQKVYVAVTFDTNNNNKIQFRADRITAIPSISTVSKVDLLRLKDLNELRTALGQNQDQTAATAPTAANVAESSDVPWNQGAAVPGGAGLSFKDGETKV